MPNPERDNVLLRELEEIDDALGDLETDPTPPQILRQTLLAVERREFVAALKRANGVGVQTARLLGISRDTYNRRMKIFGLNAADWRRSRRS